MAIKNKLIEIDEYVSDVLTTEFEYYTSPDNVPNYEDSNLSFENGEIKKGKVIDTCVLFVDIRNSVALTEKHNRKTMGRIYTAFVSSVCKLADHHNGKVRNIIGDRVMIVFPVKDCFTNAVECAISINHISSEIISKHFKTVDFKCGIGIDYGKLRVIKVGIPKRGKERTENKGLVWVGYPANLASRLTDIANKEINEEYYEVKRNPINPRAISPFLNLSILMMGESDSSKNTKEPLHLETIETIKLTPIEFADTINQHDSGTLFTTGGKMLSFKKIKNEYKMPPILMTESVYNGYKTGNPNCDTIKKKMWKEQTYPIKNITSKVYGGTVTWKI